MNTTFRLSCICLIFAQLSAQSQIIGTPVYYEDFSEGIPADWSNVTGSGISYWEYRGPSTDPGISVASRGSCGVGSIPITSLTQSNGFVIFDSNYWDDNDGVCGGLGTGQDPAPHEAILTTAPINLTGVSTPVLTFQQSFKHYQVTTKVEISNNGGNTWTTILTNTGVTSPSAEWKTVNITTQAANQPDVRIRFVLTGTYYWWQLDDIAIYAPSANDLVMSNPKYTLYNESVSPFLKMMYHTYPTTMLPNFKFACTGSNVGANTQTGVRLYVDVKQGATPIYSGSTSAINIAAGVATNLVFMPSFAPPAVVGNYDIYYNLDQSQADATPLNNLDTLDYRIDEWQLGRDEAIQESIFVPAPIYQDEDHEIGNTYDVTLAGRKCHSVSAVLAEGTQPGSVLYAKFYDINLMLLGESAPYVVNEWDINEPGEEKEVVLPLINPVTMFVDSIYIAVIGHDYSGGGQMRVGRSGSSVAETSIVRYPQSNGLFYMLSTPMVRIGVFPLASNPGCTDPNAMNYEPGATVNDGTCRYPGCTDPLACNYNPTANFEDGSCIDPSCSDPLACNYNPSAVCTGACVYECGLGCTDIMACNYDSGAATDDGSCDYSCLGCTDPTACNYDALATIANNTCDYSCYGCSDAGACNYDPTATINDGTCDYTCLGCTDPTACNYDATATIEDNTCDYTCYGCIDAGACNYNNAATIDNGTCDYSCLGCTDPTACNYDATATIEDNSCDYSCYGCIDAGACNYNSAATIDNGTCDYSCLGCTDPTACNYDATATIEDNTCDFSCYGCIDAGACNYDLTATINDGTCTYPGCTDPTANNYDSTAGCDNGTCTYINCLGDLSGDGEVNVEDLILFTGSYGCPSGCQFDITGDDEVDLSDLLVFIGEYGDICE